MSCALGVRVVRHENAEATLFKSISLRRTAPDQLARARGELQASRRTAWGYLHTGMLPIGPLRASWGVGGPASSSAPISRSNPL